MSACFEGQCDFCHKTKAVQHIRQGGAVQTIEAEYKVREAVESATGQPIAAFPKLCLDCFINISKR